MACESSACKAIDDETLECVDGYVSSKNYLPIDCEESYDCVPVGVDVLD